MPETGLVELHLKPEMLARHGLPDIGYPIPAGLIATAMAGEGELDFAALLFGLQQSSASGDSDWHSLEPAMARLAELIAPDDPRETVTAAGEEWWIELGLVDLDGPVVTIQRGQELIAAICSRPDGRLRLDAFRPLDGRSARVVIAGSVHPHPQDGVAMRENNWEYLLDNSAGTGQYYAFDRGEAHLSYWEFGIGIMQNGAVDETWRAKRGIQPRPVPHVAVELGVAYAFS